MSIEQNNEKTPNRFPKWIRWTGFADKTLWDWMQLLIVPIVLGAGALWFQAQSNRTSQQSEEQRAKAQRTIESDRERQAALQAYLASISTLLLDKNLSRPSEDDPVMEIARTNTLSTLRQLDADRKRLLITFLYDSRLIGFISRPSSRDQDDSDSTEETPPTRVQYIIDMEGADLSGANLSDAFLEGIDLFGVNLTNADLTGAVLNDAVLSNANLSGAVLRFADLSDADLSDVILEASDRNTNPTQITVSVDIEGALLRGADLSGADLSDADLVNAASLVGATLPNGTVMTEAAWKEFKKKRSDP